MKMEKWVVYDRLNGNRKVSCHKSAELAEEKARKLGCGDRFGILPVREWRIK